MAYDRRKTSKLNESNYSNDRERISSEGNVQSGYNDVADMYDTMFTDNRTEDQKELQKARATSFLSGMPIIGLLIQGVENARQLEDYYNNTGMLPNYPGNSGIGYGRLGSAVSNTAMSLIPDGQNDLYQFYTGEPDRTMYW